MARITHYTSSIIHVLIVTVLIVTILLAFGWYISFLLVIYLSSPTVFGPVTNPVTVKTCYLCQEYVMARGQLGLCGSGAGTVLLIV